MSLPPDYTWHPWTGDDLALKLGDRLVAMVRPFESSGCRSTRNIGRTTAATEDHETTERAIAFIEAWARRWDERIRRQYAHDAQELTTPRPDPSDPPLQTTHPRRRSRRR